MQKANLRVSNRYRKSGTLEMGLDTFYLKILRSVVVSGASKMISARNAIIDDEFCCMRS